MDSRAVTHREMTIGIVLVAIVAAGCAFLTHEGQIARKVAQARSDMRSIGMALEAYRADYPRYPLEPLFYHPTFGRSRGIPEPDPLLRCLTTPTAYINRVPKDVFPASGTLLWSPGFKDYIYEATDSISINNFFLPAGTPRIDPDQWILASVGPDGCVNYGMSALFGEEYLNSRPATSIGARQGCLYDPTNGAVSDGDLVQLGRDMKTGQ